jgi:hypothetical protein
MNIKQYLRSSALIALVSFSGMTQATVINVIKIGTWSTAPGADLAPTQKYVVKIKYDDTSTVDTRDVLTGGFADSGQDMSVIELTGGTNTLDIFVPMEGLDTSTPFIYTQNDSNHFDLGFGTPEPTLNFVAGSDVTDTANIIGIEFEGDFAPDFASNQNIIELFNTTPGAATPINQVGQILNCADDFCVSSSIAASGTNTLVDAVDVTVNDGAVTYDATMLVQTTTLAVQSNELGAGRSDGETFLDADWTESGGALTGNLEADGANIEVGIANSGLATTTSTTTWDLTLTEQMTELSDTAEVLVNYTNDAPSSTLSATANASGYDFTYTFDDLDLAVAAIIAGFEVLTYDVLYDGVVSTLFDDLIANGMLSLTAAALGFGSHTLAITVTDLAGASHMSDIAFDVAGVSPVPIPSAFFLMLTALGFLGATRFKKQRS